MQRRTKVLGAAALVLCITVAWPIAAHYRLKAKLAAYQRQLRAQGEKLTTKELTPPLSAEGIRAADALIAVGNRLSGPGAYRPPAMQFAAPGHAIVGWQQEPLVTGYLTNVWPLWSALIASNAPLLAQARAALQSPRLMVPLDYSQGLSLDPPHLDLFSSLSWWLSTDTLVALHQHHPEQAWASLESLVALAQRYTDEPVRISVRTRGDIIDIATRTTWEALQSPELQEPQLRALQALWTAVDVLTQAEATLSMQRAMHGPFFAYCRVCYANFDLPGLSSGAGDLSEIGQELLKDPKEGITALVYRYPRYCKWKGWSSYEEELAEAQCLQAGLETLRTARQQGALRPALPGLEQTISAIMQHCSNTRVFTSPPGTSGTSDFLSRVSTFEIQHVLVVTALALKRHQLAHGVYPPHLNALVPEFLPQLPRDPADGQTLHYRLRADGSFLLYSAGLDGIDNGGNPHPGPDNSDDYDSLPRWLRGADIVWPSVATAEETKAAYAPWEAEHRRRLAFTTDQALRNRYNPAPAPTPAPPPNGTTTNATNP